MVKMECETSDKTVKLLPCLMLDVGERMLVAGAEVSRIEDMLQRLGHAYGILHTNVFVITSSISVTLELADGQLVTHTRRINIHTGNNLESRERIGRLIKQVCEGNLSMEQLWSELAELDKVKENPFEYPGSMLGAAGFTVFFGGNIKDAIVSAAFGIFICFFQKKLSVWCLNQVVFNLTISFLSGIGICLITQEIPGFAADKIMIGDIMLLIPGLTVTSAMRDMIVGDTISGLLRLIESIWWAGALACGFMAAIWLTGI